MKKGIPLLALLVTPLLVSCSVFPGWGEPEVDHVTLSEPAEALDVPTNVRSVGWTWSSPEETSVRHVSPISYGLAVSISDGVVGVSGETGEELWRYRRLGEDSTSVNVTPDGETVAVSYSAHDGEPEGEEEPPPLHEVVLLDASTGEIKGTQVAEFADMHLFGNNRSSFTSVNQRLGVLSNSSRIIYRSNEGEGTDVVAFGLEGGKEQWSVSPTQGDGNDDRVFVPRAAVVSRDVLILSSTFMDKSVMTSADADEPQEHIIALIGIDVETGSELWRHELEVNNSIAPIPFNLEVERTSGMVAAVAGGHGYYDEWLLDPVSGEDLSDAGFFTGQDDTVVGILEEFVVSVRRVSEGEEYEYSYSKFSGEVQQSVTVPAPVERWEDQFILAMQDSIAWLDVDEQAADDLSWGQARLMVTDRDDGRSRVIDLGIQVQRRPNNDGSLGMFTPIPAPKNMVLAPGVLVVAEDLKTGNGLSRRLVGLVP